eukprot:1070843-Rhodomonas_salina.2
MRGGYSSPTGKRDSIRESFRKASVLSGGLAPPHSIVSESDSSGKGHWWALLQHSSFSEEEDSQSVLRDAWFDTVAFWSHFAQTLRKVPIIPAVVFLLFAILCGGSITMVSLYYDREQVARKQAASAIAQSLATSLSAQFDLILLPMFALAVDASTDAELFSGTEIIDSWPVDLSKDPPTHRIPDYNNRTVQYTARFEQIASQLHVRSHVACDRY